MSAEWVRLGSKVRERRDELNLTQQQVQDRGGPSTSTLRRLENGYAIALTRSKRRDLERMLRWPQGRVDAILQDKRRPSAPRPSRITGDRVFTAETGRRWRRALTVIAAPGCLQMARTCCCYVPHLPHADWCAPCVAHNALNPHARDVEVQR